MLTHLALAGTRISLGMLLVVWAVQKLLKPGMSSFLADKFYGGILSGETLHYIANGAQLIIGVLVVIGLFRKFVLPIQSVILAVTAVAVWYAILDPFNWYIAFDDGFAFSHLFYPSIIAFFASLIMIAKRGEDRWAVDTKLGR